MCTIYTLPHKNTIYATEVIQIFNKIKNESLVDGNVENNNNKQLLAQLKLIFKSNFESKIENHKANNATQ